MMYAISTCNLQNISSFFIFFSSFLLPDKRRKRAQRMMDSNGGSRLIEGIIVSLSITVNLVMTLDPEGISRISALSLIRVEYLPASVNNSRQEVPT